MSDVKIPEGLDRCAMAVCVSDGCGYTIDGARALCDDVAALAGHQDPYGKPLYRQTCDCRNSARAVIEALIEEPASGALLARVEEVARSLNPSRSEDHIKSVALDALSIHRAILRTALSQPNEEGEGK